MQDHRYGPPHHHHVQRYQHSHQDRSRETFFVVVHIWVKRQNMSPAEASLHEAE